ncbi:histidine kinase [Rudaea sp.]|uniref:sensor histidine kinase n=1 Tax=Rudaea sp. TaxID=2136325 RepID=UPI002ED17603
MKLRGSTLWIATIHGVLAVEADGRIRRKAVSEGVGKYRSLLIDREGSLWLGTFAGLLQFPEPDTWNWLHARVVGIWQTADTIWVQAPDWSIYRVEKTTGELVQDALKGVLCVTPNQQVSAVFADKIYSWRGSSFRSGEFKAIADMPVPVDMSHHLYCEADHNGTLWVGTNEGLFRLAPGRDKAIRINFPGLSPDDIHPFWFDAGDDRPWTLLGDRVCRLQADNDGNTTVSECVVSGTALGYAYSALRIDAQRLWISDFSVYELGADTGLRRLPGNRDFADAKVSHLAPAADGHAWLSGGTATRVRPCDDCADGWQIVERLSSWHGLTGNTNQVVETADGDVWIGGLTGIWRVPKRVRDTPLSVPRVIAVHAQVDADVRDLTAPIEVAPSDHRLELEFATLTYRDRSLLRFRSRFGDNGKWSTPVQDSHLQFAALEPGNYHVEAEASLDGEHWSEQPATIDFKVLPPWYRTWWAYVLYLLAVLGLIALFVRQRVAAALRVERERTRIAMDLHDEIGSGLGSIGMLAGAAKRSSASEQLRLVGEIGDLASLLSSGLRSVVWSLRSGKAGIVELGEQIADQARRLFTHGAPNLELHLPDRGTVVPVPSDVHRNTLMIAFEALHNIARHAHAGSVRVSLGAGADAGFVLVIEDDGAGFRPDEQFAGAGLESMRRRADAIGAHYAVASNAGRGTRITLAYPARSP